MLDVLRVGQCVTCREIAAHAMPHLAHGDRKLAEGDNR